VPLLRIHRHFLARVRSIDRRLLALLLVWLLGLVVPAIHTEFDEDGTSSRARETHVRCAECDRKATTEACVKAACADGSDCRNPHHHHPHEHADAQCPICSTQLARVALAPNFAAPLAPRTVRFVDVRAAAVRPLAERRVIALARGPPPSPIAG
jgi:hypothetical protein